MHPDDLMMALQCVCEVWEDSFPSFYPKAGFFIEEGSDGHSGPDKQKKDIVEDQFQIIGFRRPGL